MRLFFSYKVRQNIYIYVIWLFMACVCVLLIEKEFIMYSRLFCNVCGIEYTLYIEVKSVYKDYLRETWKNLQIVKKKRKRERRKYSKKEWKNADNTNNNANLRTLTTTITVLTGRWSLCTGSLLLKQNSYFWYRVCLFSSQALFRCWHGKLPSRTANQNLVLKWMARERSCRIKGGNSAVARMAPLFTQGFKFLYSHACLQRPPKGKWSL